MAYGIGSIIGDVDQKAQTYYNKPDALAQMFQQNQQLVDLLALQKIKSDKEAAIRSMQMQQSAPAATIKDQRANEVMSMTKAEVAQQIAPGLQMAGQRAQQAQAPQAQAPQAQGISSLPAPNMQPMGMAQGGIVGYKEGKLVKGEEDPLDYAQVDPQLAGLRSPSLMKSLVEFLARKNAEAERYRRTGSTAEPSTYTAEVGPPLNAPKLSEGYRFTPQTVSEAGTPSLVQQRVIGDPENEANVAMATETLPAMQRAAPTAPTDPRISRYEDRLAKLQAQDESTYDRVMAFLRGAGASGGTNLGATMTGGATGVQARAEDIQSQIDQAIQNLEGMDLKREEMDLQESQFTRGLESEEAMNAATIAQRDREAAANAKATIQNAYYDLQGQLSKQQMELMGDAIALAQESRPFAMAVDRLGKLYKNDPTRLMLETMALVRESAVGYAGIISDTTGGGAELLQPAE